LAASRKQKWLLECESSIRKTKEEEKALGFVSLNGNFVGKSNKPSKGLAGAPEPPPIIAQPHLTIPVR